MNNSVLLKDVNIDINKIKYSYSTKTHMGPNVQIEHTFIKNTNKYCKSITLFIKMIEHYDQSLPVPVITIDCSKLKPNDEHLLKLDKDDLNFHKNKIKQYINKNSDTKDINTLLSIIDFN